MLLRASQLPLPEVAWGPVPPPVFERLELGQTLPLGSACFLRGWGVHEKHGNDEHRWSGVEGYLVLRPGAGVGAVELECAIPGEVAHSELFFVDVRGDRLLARARVASGTKHTVVVPLPRGDEVLMRVVCSSVAVPHLLGQNEDRRILGLLVSAVRGAAG